jgi:quercetin dioxygenase-like cupin family protein
MALFRLYSGDDGQSHIEAQNLESHPALKSPQLAKHIVFQEFARGVFIDWHPAPRRQYVIILSGELEIGLGGTPREHWETPRYSRQSCR